MAGMKQGKICIHEHLKVTALKGESLWRSAAFTLSSCIQNFPSPCKKPLLMTYLLKELFIKFIIYTFINLSVSSIWIGNNFIE